MTPVADYVTLPCLDLRCDVTSRKVERWRIGGLWCAMLSVLDALATLLLGTGEVTLLPPLPPVLPKTALSNEARHVSFRRRCFACAYSASLRRAFVCNSAKSHSLATTLCGS